ncbi:MAG: alkyl sulfatase dimerization domain-containing protein [Pseudomonadota bacterium]
MGHFYLSRRETSTSGLLGLLVVTIFLSGCGQELDPIPVAPGADEAGFSAPSEFTLEKNQNAADALPLADPVDFEQAKRGLIASADSLLVDGRNGGAAWNRDAYDFIQGEAPGSVHPSLWRQAQLNNIHGLFEVTEGIYQIRGYDLANMTLIEGEKGWIVVDPMTSTQTGEAGMSFALQHLNRKPISAVLFTHSHIDHFGGVLGVLAAAGSSPEEVEVIAPAGFMDEATSENILAGPTMMRRAQYMYGMHLPRTERGHVDTGLGKEPASGDYGLLKPTRDISATGDRLIVDGVEFVFQIVSGSEAPAEFTFYLPEFKAFCGAELLSRNMHNLYTLRGAKVRDALAWSRFIDEVDELFPETDIYFASHHWPIWGSENVRAFLEVQRDTYKFLHDQTLRFAYQGYTPKEIAERIELPASLQQEFSNRGYYGTVYHNVRAVYQLYFGWYDGNPANLAPHPPEEEAKRYVEAMGGDESVIRLAQAAYEQGDYRWAATLLNHVVFYDRENQQARALLAKCYDQLGYQAESGPWRDNYLTGALELRQGVPETTLDPGQAKGIIQYAERSHFFDVMAAQIDAEKAEDVQLTINFNFTDLDENHVLTVKNAVMHHRIAPKDESADATLNMTQELFLGLILAETNFAGFLLSDDLDIEGSRLDLAKFFSLQDRYAGNFDIVFP